MPFVIDSKVTMASPDVTSKFYDKSTSSSSTAIAAAGEIDVYNNGTTEAGLGNGSISVIAAARCVCMCVRVFREDCTLHCTIGFDLSPPSPSPSPFFPTHPLLTDVTF